MTLLYTIIRFVGSGTGLNSWGFFHNNVMLFASDINAVRNLSS